MENRLQILYWNELVQLKVSCEYIRRYRDFLSLWVTRFAMIRAFVSVGGAWDMGGGKSLSDGLGRRDCRGGGC